MKKMLVVALIVVAGLFILSTPNVMAQCDWDYRYSICTSDLDLDCDADANDVGIFLTGFGRSLFFKPCAPNGPAPVEKTGQTTSFATGDDGDLEKGVAWPNARFNDRGNGTIVDNLTGLTWLKNANCFGVISWVGALGVCNSLEDGLCGLADASNPGDWRLPNYKELISLVDLKNYGPALPSSHPFDFGDEEFFLYWSSSTYAFDFDYAWYVGMGNGKPDSFRKDSVSFHSVWCVRGGH